MHNVFVEFTVTVAPYDAIKMQVIASATIPRIWRVSPKGA